MARRKSGLLGALQWLFTAEKPTRKRSRARPKTAEQYVKAENAIERRIERAERDGEKRAAEKYRSQLDALKARADAAEKRASGSPWLQRNPTAPKQLERAEESSDRFHGTDKEVVELSMAERARLPKYAPVYGRIRAIEVEPRRDSARGDTIWRHLFSDRGPLSPKNVRAALLVWDPRNPKRIAIVQEDDKPGNGEDVHMDERRGIVG